MKKYGVRRPLSSSTTRPSGHHFQQVCGPNFTQGGQADDGYPFPRSPERSALRCCPHKASSAAAWSLAVSSEGPRLAYRNPPTGGMRLRYCTLGDHSTGALMAETCFLHPDDDSLESELLLIRNNFVFKGGFNDVCPSGCPNGCVVGFSILQKIWSNNGDESFYSFSQPGGKYLFGVHCNNNGSSHREHGKFYGLFGFTKNVVQLQLSVRTRKNGFAYTNSWSDYWCSLCHNRGLQQAHCFNRSIGLNVFNGLDDRNKQIKSNYGNWIALVNFWSSRNLFQCWQQCWSRVRRC